MGGGSVSGSDSNSSTSGYSNSSRTNTYGSTTTSNPYLISHTDNSGTTTKFQPGSGLEQVNTFVNDNLTNLLNEYVNPTLDSKTNQAKMDLYQKYLGKNTKQSLENDIINPLAKRNMIRSSQATQLYNNLANQVADKTADYSSELLANAQNDTSNIINNLMNYYLQGFNAVNGNQALSLNTSQGNATQTGHNNYGSNTSRQSTGYGYSVSL